MAQRSFKKLVNARLAHPELTLLRSQNESFDLALATVELSTIVTQSAVQSQMGVC